MKTRLCLFGAALGVLILAEPASLQAQSSDPSMMAAMEIRFQQMEKEIRRLTGQIEEQNYEIRQLKDELAKVTGDLDVRIRDIEGGNGAPSMGSVVDEPFDAAEERVPVSSSSNYTTHRDGGNTRPVGGFYTPPDGNKDTTRSLGTLNESPDGALSSDDNAARAYEYAYSFIKNRDFDSAEKEFAAFINQYPESELVSNAQYWYGETFYVRGNYEKSARIFAEGYQQYPKGPKAASNLLKLGMALSGMGKTDDACIAYKQLKKEYAASAVSLLKRAETEMQKINCR